MSSYTPTKFIKAVADYIDNDIEIQEDKNNYIDALIETYDAFESYIFNDVFEGMELNTLPSYVSDALKLDISSFQNQDGLKWLYDYVKNEKE